ncbi:protein SNORC isoform X2 [Calonectris borealis]|uniref:protein SNORC isoform X2 n=1 Tax=Calonectris borealis TaxID=1323832 RepID=UPI003F4C8AEA
MVLGRVSECPWYTERHRARAGVPGGSCALPQGAQAVCSGSSAALFTSPEYPQGPVPTLWNEPPELPSGAGPFDAATTTARLSDATAFPPYTSELEPEDTTHLHRLDAGDGSLGPGAIGAIVIASLLGTSVLVALVVITLRKFSAS